MEPADPGVRGPGVLRALSRAFEDVRDVLTGARRHVGPSLRCSKVWLDSLADSDPNGFHAPRRCKDNSIFLLLDHVTGSCCSIMFLIQDI